MLITGQSIPAFCNNNLPIQLIGIIHDRRIDGVHWKLRGYEAGNERPTNQAGTLDREKHRRGLTCADLLHRVPLHIILPERRWDTIEINGRIETRYRDKETRQVGDEGIRRIPHLDRL